MQSQPLNPDHLAALLQWARKHKFPTLTRICLAAQRGDEAAEAAVALAVVLQVALLLGVAEGAEELAALDPEIVDDGAAQESIEDMREDDENAGLFH